MGGDLDGTLGLGTAVSVRKIKIGALLGPALDGQGGKSEGEKF